MYTSQPLAGYRFIRTIYSKFFLIFDVGFVRENPAVLKTGKKKFVLSPNMSVIFFHIVYSL